MNLTTDLLSDGNPSWVITEPPIIRIKSKQIQMPYDFWRILCAFPGSKLMSFFYSTRFILMNLGCVVVNEFADDENPYEPPPIMPSEYLDTFKVLRMCLLCMAQPNLTSFDTFVSRRFSKLRTTRNYVVTTKGSYNII